MSQVTGIVTVKIDGTLVRSKDGASLDFGGFERTMQTGYKVYGYTQKVAPSVLTFTLAHVGGDDLVGLAAKVDSTIEFITDTGDTYIMKSAVCTKPAKLTGGDGDAEFEFQGEPAEKS